MSEEKLKHRLNRVVGQIDSIRRKIEAGKDDDCIKTLQQLKASINALKKFGEAYMTLHLEACLERNMSSEKIKENLKTVISGAFSL